ncbi:hypothetical protein GR183_12035 [Stappia sp. GBMRC 2046]|uniref:Lectin-like protein BA14k n=1 Tax=Stappia sediminis TaxID=2692190 RepID=A0A7X3LV24_9HYPH|nr:hypothetical protein [Stappia sediminis]MXN65634.1 hypothetical protein [Stappia sediminis]
MSRVHVTCVLALSLLLAPGSTLSTSAMPAGTAFAGGITSVAPEMPVTKIQSRRGGGRAYRGGGGYRGGGRYYRGGGRSYRGGGRSYRGGGGYYRGGGRHYAGRGYHHGGRWYGPRYRYRRPGFTYFYGGWWYPYIWWGAPALAYAPRYYAQPVVPACQYWSDRCIANWGYANPNYYGCLRYHRCY